MSARDQILKRIRAGLGRDALDESRSWPLEQRMASPTPVLLPASSRLKGDPLIARFVSKAEKVDATVVRLSSMDRIPAAVRSYLDEHAIEPTVRTAPHPAIAELDWEANGITASAGIARDEDRVGITLAYAAVAESGTLVMTAGPETPTTLNYLPDDSLIVLRLSDLVGSYEQVWQRLRSEHGPRHEAMTRVVNWITGPSRTADIEQTLLLGIHGPRRLHILLVEQE